MTDLAILGKNEMHCKKATWWRLVLVGLNAYVSHEAIRYGCSSGHMKDKQTIASRQIDAMHLSYHDARASVVLCG